MKFYLLSIIIVLCPCFEAGAQQTGSDLTESHQTVSGQTGSNQSESSISRAELKQSVSRMTYESGDRRILKLNGRLENLGQSLEPKFKSKPARPKSKLGAYPDITVQCSPLGEAEAIGVLPKKKKTYRPKTRGAEIDIDVPSSLNFSNIDWRRLAKLACQEDEI